MKTVAAGFLSAISLSGMLSGCAVPQRIMAVNVPVVDLRAQPHTSSQPGVHDPLQETQLLYGERVNWVITRNGWARIEAIEQPEFTHDRRWQGYPGWVPASSLIAWDPWLEPTIVVTDKWVRAWEDPNGLRASLLAFALGTRLKAIDIAGQLWRVELLNGAAVWIPHQAACSLKSLRGLSPREKRQAILRMAEVFLNDAYSWGGRSPAASSPAGKAADAPQGQDRATGVDCSGLTNLAYRAAGIDIPRDAHEQHLRARPVTTLEPADLIFLSERGNPQRIVHVMLYAGDGQLMEGPGTGTAVRRITVQERLGRPLDRLASGTVIEEQTVRFGSYLP